MPHARNLRFDALAVAEGSDLSQLPREAGGRIAKALAEIVKATPDVTPDEITRRAANYRRLFPRATVTANAIASHWARLGEAPEEQFEFWKRVRQLELTDADLLDMRQRWHQDTCDGPVFTDNAAGREAKAAYLELRATRKRLVQELLDHRCDDFRKCDRQLRIVEVELVKLRNLGLGQRLEANRQRLQQLRSLHRELREKVRTL